LLAGRSACWVACAMSEADRKAAAKGLMKPDGIELLMVEPDPSTYRMAYDVVSNSTLWFCHHHLFDLSRRPRLDRFWAQAWDGYREFNRAFAAVVEDSAPLEATVLVQDYHLCLLPEMLYRVRPDLRIAHFTHTPFADPSMFRVLPDAAAGELLRGMSAARACGFHTRRWAEAFEGCCNDHGVEPPRTFVSPLAPDPSQLHERMSSRTYDAAKKRIDSLVGDMQVVLSVDRVELSKNLLRGLWSFDEMLRDHPEMHEKVVMLSLAYLSRQGLPEYLAYGAEVEHAAQLVNEAWSTDTWQPVVLDIADDPDRSLAALTRYDVLLVNPIRDGLNLVAKEGPLVNATDGVLALSREAGAFAELSEEALEINPFDVTGTAHVLASALSMSPAEKMRRAEGLRKLLARRDPGDWLTDQISSALG
jgi:trehalose 6-phosphate synthase